MAQTKHRKSCGIPGRAAALHSERSAVLAVNKSMSIDLQDDGVTSVLLHPGWVRTGMTRGVCGDTHDACASSCAGSGCVCTLLCFVGGVLSVCTHVDNVPCRQRVWGCASVFS